MFSIMAALPLVPLNLPRGVVPLGAFEAAKALDRQVLRLGWPTFDALLPDGGLPRGVVEIASRHALGGPTRIAARAIAAAQEKNPKAWCAWIDPDATLHAPGLARAGADLARLFVVRPPRSELGRIAVKVARAGAFDVVVVDMDSAFGGRSGWLPQYPARKARKPLPPEVVVRKLALAADEGATTVILLTDITERRAIPWPVALRLECERRPDTLNVRVAKDHRGRAGLARTSVPIAELQPQRPARAAAGGLP
jgi:hypothetical protein